MTFTDVFLTYFSYLFVISAFLFDCYQILNYSLQKDYEEVVGDRNIVREKTLCGSAPYSEPHSRSVVSENNRARNAKRCLMQWCNVFEACLMLFVWMLFYEK